MNYLPINLKLKDQTVLVLGGGSVALRKIRRLLQVDAKVVCIAQQFEAALQQMAKAGTITIRTHDLNDLSLLNQYPKVRIIISATDNNTINHAIHHYCQQKAIWVNTVDHQALCDFITPAIVDRSPVVVAISSEGAAPVLTRMLKQKIEYLLPLRLSALAKTAQSLRAKIKRAIPGFNQRRQFWERFFRWSHQTTDLNPDNHQPTDTHGINQLIAAVNQTRGKVTLVGAGPGDPDLLTLGAIKAIQSADVVLHDHLISEEIMALIRQDATLVDVGKQAGNHQTKQQNINQQLIDLAQQGLQVCRLKGGDSFVFGRGGEEALALQAADVPIEIVPGITAAVGCAAFAGIPLTHRDHAQSLALMTAHCSDSIDTIDWQFYAKENQTLAVYMGLIKAESLTAALVQHGKSPFESVAIIENGTRNNQRTITGQLTHLADMISEHQIKSPALIVIGQVAAYATQLDWFKPHISHLESVNQAYLKSA